jgi:hypothetical protein
MELRMITCDELAIFTSPHTGQDQYRSLLQIGSSASDARPNGGGAGADLHQVLLSDDCHAALSTAAEKTVMIPFYPIFNGPLLLLVLTVSLSLPTPSTILYTH